MYSSNTASVFGFHGLDEETGIKIINNLEQLKHSVNDYDWLGKGIYFWENNYERAKQWADQQAQLPKNIKKTLKPFVIGAVIDFGVCLDFLDQKWLDFLSIAYKEFKIQMEKEDKSLPTNGAICATDFDFKKRELDCAVIRYAHELATRRGIKFDTVRAAFWEGDELYPNAGFKMHNHIQIAVINPDCIKVVFWPREKMRL